MMAHDDGRSEGKEHHMGCLIATPSAEQFCRINCVAKEWVLV